MKHKNKKQYSNKTKSKKSYSEFVSPVAKVAPGVLPESSREALDRLSRFQDNSLTLPTIHEFKSVENGDQRMQNVALPVRVRLTQVLAVFIARMDWATLRVGVAKVKNMEMIRHSSLIDLYNKMWPSDRMAPSTWFEYVDKLKDAGYLHSEAVNLKDDTTENGSAKKIKGVPGYKWLTAKFFKELGLDAKFMTKAKSFAITALTRTNRSNDLPVYFGKKAALLRQKALLVNEYQSSFEHLNTEAELMALVSSPIH